MVERPWTTRRATSHSRALRPKERRTLEQGGELRWRDQRFTQERGKSFLDRMIALRRAPQDAERDRHKRLAGDHLPRPPSSRRSHKRTTAARRSRDSPDCARCADPDHVRRLALGNGGSPAWIAGLPARVPATARMPGPWGGKRRAAFNPMPRNVQPALARRAANEACLAARRAPGRKPAEIHRRGQWCPGRRPSLLRLRTRAMRRRGVHSRREAGDLANEKGWL